MSQNILNWEAQISIVHWWVKNYVSNTFSNFPSAHLTLCKWFFLKGSLTFNALKLQSTMYEPNCSVRNKHHISISNMMQIKQGFWFKTILSKNAFRIDMGIGREWCDILQTNVTYFFACFTLFLLKKSHGSPNVASQIWWLFSQTFEQTKSLNSFPQFMKTTTTTKWSKLYHQGNIHSLITS